MARVAAAISRIAAQRECGADDWLANSSSDSGRKRISSVLPTTPCQPRSRMWSTISTGLAPESARSPPWRIKSGRFVVDRRGLLRTLFDFRGCRKGWRCALGNFRAWRVWRKFGNWRWESKEPAGRRRYGMAAFPYGRAWSGAIVVAPEKKEVM